MSRIRNVVYSLTLLFCIGIVHAQPAKTKKAGLDASVESLMDQSRYRDASNLISTKLKNNPGIDNDLRLYYSNRQSIAQLRLRNIDSALILAQQSLTLSARSSDSSLVADAWKSASYAHNHAGHLDSALFFTKKMLLFGERNGDDKISRNAIVSMATILSQSKRFGEAMTYYRMALSLTMKLHDTAYYASAIYNLGLAFLNLQKTDSCLVYLQQAAEYAEKDSQDDLLVYIYGTMADCYLLLKNDKERKKNLLLANGIAEKIGNKQFLAMGYSNLTQGALENRNFGEAIVYGNKALDLLKEQPYPVLKLKVDSMMCMAYKGTGNYIEAYAYLETFVQEKEKLVNEKQQEQLNEMVVALQAREKDLTIARQKFEIARKQRNMQVLGLVIGIIVVLAGGQLFFILRSRRFRKELFRKEKDLDRQSAEIRTWMEWRYGKGLEKNVNADKFDTDREIAGEKDGHPAQATLFAGLREIFDTQKMYLDPELNIKSVVKALGTNQKYLYQAISENSDANFRSFVNRYRVDEARKIIERKIRMKEKLNFQEICTSSGFNSTVSFYRAFKHFTGLAPKEYAEEARREMKFR